jgi:hypothetical protein
MAPSRQRVAALVTVLCVGALAACGGASETPGASDAGAPDVGYGRLSPDAGVASDASHAWERMHPHAGRVMANMAVGAVYIGESDGADSFDPLMQWLVGSDYWGTMRQYSVEYGSWVGSARVPTSAVFPAGSVQGGLIDAGTLGTIVQTLLHGSGSPLKGRLGSAQAYVVFLPNGVDAIVGTRGGVIYQTCIGVGAYHSDDGVEPYAIIGSCALGRSDTTVSHELAELATDPFGGAGWFSDQDLDHGGEIADLCDLAVPGGIDGWALAQLWSNADGECVPRGQ